MKSKSMIMGSSRKIPYRESNFNIFYDDVLLNDVKYEKLLGGISYFALRIILAARFCNLHSFSRFKFVVSPHTVQQYRDGALVMIWL
jgi:hypothetical protein